MRKWVICVMLTLSMVGGASAQGADIEDVINRQMDAFKADDFSTAFTFASPNIRNMFRTPENFGRMVAQGYPMVWRPAEIEYLDLREEGGSLKQTIRIVDQKGGVHLLDYSMIETPDGWKINGVQILQAPDVST